MTGIALKCPQCAGPLNPGKFARLVVCPHCGSTVTLGERTIKAELFRNAYKEWNSPSNNGFTEWLTVNGKHWAVGRKIALGHISDVYFAIRARWPTECILIKVLRNPHDLPRFENTWKILTELKQSKAPGAETFSNLTPQPVFYGKVESGVFAGTNALAYRWAEGFNFTLEQVKRTHKKGIQPRSSIWLWRRILEILSFLHGSGYVHGSLLPPHLMVEDGEHGVRLVGYGCAGSKGSKLKHVLPKYEDYYPNLSGHSQTLTPEFDITMSARTIAFMVGGDPETGEVPDVVPKQLAELISEAANGKTASAGSGAWTLRELLGKLSDEIYGTPEFCPIVVRENKED